MFFGLEKGPESKLGHTCFCCFFWGGKFGRCFFLEGLERHIIWRHGKGILLSSQSMYLDTNCIL